MLSKKYLGKIKTLSCLTAIIFFSYIDNSIAQVAPSSCDPEYYESLQAKAWMEAQREITQNQNFIRKPDSVLQYTCFDRYINIINTEVAGLIESDAATRWGAPRPALSTAVLDGLLMVPMAEYLQGNFGVSATTGGDSGYTLLGGYATTDLGADPAIGAINASGYYDMIDMTTALNRSYACDVMNVVWEAMRCTNFIEDPATQGFFTLEDYAGFTDDLRQVNYDGATRTCGGPAGADTWVGSYGEALGANPAIGATDTRGWAISAPVSYRSNFEPPPGTGTNPCAASPRFRTGLLVTSPNVVGNYPETICTMAGCIFEGDPADPVNGGECVPGS